MRGPYGAAGHQRAQCQRHLDLAAMTAQCVDARVERPIRAFRRVSGQRAGDQRGLEHPLGFEQAGHRQRR